MTSSHILKLFMAPCMHKWEIWKENSSFDSGVSGSYIVLPLCWEDRTKQNKKSHFLYLHNTGIKNLFWEPHGHFSSFTFTNSWLKSRNRYWGTNLRTEKPWLAQHLGPGDLPGSLPTYIALCFQEKSSIFYSLGESTQS